MATKQAVIYARVSTVEQGRGYSLQTQLETCKNYAAERGYAVVEEFTDKYSGTELERPGLDAMLKFVAGHSINIAIVHDLDRLSREPAYQAIIEMELSRAGVRVEYVLGQYEDTAEGDLSKMIKGAIAKYENRQRVERSRRGKFGRARSGFVVTTGVRAPYGYKYISEPHKGWYVIDEAEAKVVQQIYAWILDGWTCYAIAKELHARRELTRGDQHDAVAKKAEAGAWSPSTVRRIIASETYKGTWYFGKTRRQKVNGRTVQRSIPKEEWVAVAVPPIVDEHTWARAQECLTKNKSHARRNTQREYLLRSMIFCRCGRRWTARYKSHLKRAYYRCPVTEKCRWMGMCDMPGGIRQEKLEDIVWQQVAMALLNPGNLRRELARRREFSNAQALEKQVQIRKIENEIADIERKLGVLLDQILAQGFPEALVQDRKDTLLAQREQLLQAVKQLQFESSNPFPSLAEEESLLSFAERIQGSLQRVDFATKRQILELIQLRVDVITQKQVKISAAIPSGQNALSLDGSGDSQLGISGSIVTSSSE
jgi:site-specific DNA recombinase